MKQLFILSLFAIFSVQLSAQQSYPVHVGVQAVPPYSLYLTDYYGGSRDRLIVTLLNRDREQQMLQVRLRVKISNSSGFSLQSREEVPYPMLTLETGIPQRLTNTDLAPYLIPQNTTVQGYLHEGRFPAGMTEFSFQVVEYNTGRPLSGWATGRVWLEIKKPPLLNLPQKDEQVAQMQPQHIRFGWLPQHQGVASTEYEFILKELPDNGVAPQSAFMYGQEIFRTVTRLTTLNYTHFEPELIPGRRYAWQVRAIAKDGMDEIGMFENNGFSEIGWFTLNERCPAPMHIQAEGGYRKMTLSWQKLPDQQAYIVQYRARSEHDLYEWSEIRTFENRLTIHDLRPGWKYGYRVGALCTTEKPVFSLPQEITLTMDNEVRLAQCGISPDVNIENQTPNENLRVGDQVIVGGDFPMTVTQASHQGSGWYSGKGRLTVPWIFETTIAVRFDRLRINTDNRQIGGEVESETDPDASQIADLNELDYGGNKTSAAGIVFVERTVDFSIPPMPEASYDEETGELVVYDMNGTPHTVQTEKNSDGESIFPMIITDKDGNRYQVDIPEETSDDGTSEAAGEDKPRKKVVLTKVDTIQGDFQTSRLSSTSPVVVRFFRGQGKYALDEGTDNRYQRSVMLSKYYEQVGTGYIAPWKLIPSGKNDVVEAFAIESGNAFDRNKLKFALKDGTQIPAKEEAGKWILTLPGAGNGETYEVFALYETGKNKYATVGKLNVVSYREQRHTVTLVEVDGRMPQAKNLQDQLNSLYNPYGIHFEVQSDGVLKGNTSWDADGDGRLNVSGSGFFSKETAEMKALRQLYQNTQGSLYDKNSYYLFVVGTANASGEPDESYAVQGDMPRGKQFGYLFTSAAEDVGRLAAHELGHGIFTLRHTFDVNLLGEGSKGETSNLMDYGTGTELAVWQWNVMANPAPLTWFDDEEDSHLQSDELDTLLGQIFETLKSIGENGCAFVRKLSSVSFDLENSQSHTYTSLDYLIGRYENEQVSFTDALGQKTTIEEGIRLMKEFPDNNWVLHVLNGQVEICVAEQDYSQFKSLKEAKDNPEFLNRYKQDLLRCKRSLHAYLTETLSKIQSFARDDQQVEFEYNGNAYTLINNTLQVVNLSDGDINKGNWTDTNIDTRIRYYITDNGVIQVKAFGFRHSLQLIKPANLDTLSAYILEQTNAYLFENNVSNFEQDAPEVTSETFADGENISIKGKVLKVISEGVGVTTTLLKTGEMEEKTYLTSEKGISVIHAPGIVTGSVEAGVRAMTDITQIGAMVYDLAVDKQARIDAYNGLVKIKEEVKENPSELFSLLGEVILEEASGNTTDEWIESVNPETDKGRQSHLLSKGTVRTAVTVAASGRFIAKLPEIADNLVNKIRRVAKSAEELKSTLINTGEDFTRLTNARKMPGTATGTGKDITGKWLKGTDGNAGVFPKSVADNLRGKSFNNFDEFREAFWKEVANDPKLASQFGTSDISRMRRGMAPYTKTNQQIGGQRNYILHHKTPINQAGGVYDVDNLYIVTPRYHKEILTPDFHYGYGYQ